MKLETKTDKIFVSKQLNIHYKTGLENTDILEKKQTVHWFWTSVSKAKSHYHDVAGHPVTYHQVHKEVGIYNQ